jgi:uncharacterized protein YjlB
MKNINASNYSEILKSLGFKVFGTGGGNTAWHREFSDGNYVLITDDDLGHGLENSPDGIIVGAYSANGELIIDECYEGGFSGLMGAIITACGICTLGGVL